jgi:tRNA threonylcarbamoyladenosine biosynthesis protein TsaB
MLLLALDSGTAAGGMALVEDGRVLVSRFFDLGLAHSRLLMAEVEAGFELADKGPADLDAVGVAIGPGSYTGLRIGLGAAKGICLGSGAALVTVPSLECLAARLPFAPWPVCAVADSRRGEVYAALYDVSGARPQEAGPIETLAPADLVRQRETEPTIYTGGALATYPELFVSGPNVRLAPSGCDRADPSIVGILATERLARGEVADLDAAEPWYMRLPSYLQQSGK